MSEDNKLEAFVRENWVGPTTSPVNGKLYKTSLGYIRHLKSAGLTPVELLPTAASREARVLAAVNLTPADLQLSPNKFSDALDRAEIGLGLLHARDNRQTPKARYKQLMRIEKGANALSKAIKSANEHLLADLNSEAGKVMDKFHHLPSNFPDLLESYQEVVKSERQLCDPNKLPATDELPDLRALKYVITDRLPKIYEEFIEPILDEPFGASIYENEKRDGSSVRRVSYGIKFIQTCLHEFGHEMKAETIKRRFSSRSD